MFKQHVDGRDAAILVIDHDIYLIEACTLVAVFVAVFSQFISDVGYTLLNPRIRFS